MCNIVLSKDSSGDEIKRYFMKILELSKMKEEFPVSLDDVWALVYSRKSDAVLKLKEDFMEGVDYQFLRQNPQNSGAGRPVTEYRISLPCMEFLIARKHRPVFEVYREVFHAVANNSSKTPSYLIEDDKLRTERWIEEQEELLAFAKKISARAALAEKAVEEKSRIIEENQPKVDFAESVQEKNGSCSVSEMAKRLHRMGVDIGQNRLFQWLREQGLVFKNKNEPTQKALNMGVLDMCKEPIIRDGVVINYVSVTKVTPKGQEYFAHKFKDELKNKKSNSLFEDDDDITLEERNNRYF